MKLIERYKGNTPDDQQNWLRIWRFEFAFGVTHFFYGKCGMSGCRILDIPPIGITFLRGECYRGEQS